MNILPFLLQAVSMADTKAVFLEKVRQSNAACQAGDFPVAVRLYSEAIELDPRNHILYRDGKMSHRLRGIGATDIFWKSLNLWPIFLILLYSNRSAALIKMGQFTRALQDAVKAKELNRSWPKVRG